MNNSLMMLGTKSQEYIYIYMYIYEGYILDAIRGIEKEKALPSIFPHRESRDKPFILQ